MIFYFDYYNVQFKFWPVTIVATRVIWTPRPNHYRSVFCAYINDHIDKAGKLKRAVTHFLCPLDLGACATEEQWSSAGGTGDHRMSPDGGSQAPGAAGWLCREQGCGAAVAGAQSHQAEWLQEGRNQDPFKGSTADKFLLHCIWRPQCIHLYGLFLAGCSQLYLFFVCFRSLLLKWRHRISVLLTSSFSAHQRVHGACLFVMLGHKRQEYGLMCGPTVTTEKKALMCLTPVSVK